MSIQYRLLPDGITTEEVFVDDSPAWHQHVDSAGVLSLEGFIAIRQEMRLDVIERREVLPPWPC